MTAVMSLLCRGGFWMMPVEMFDGGGGGCNVDAVGRSIPATANDAGAPWPESAAGTVGLVEVCGPFAVVPFSPGV